MQIQDQEISSRPLQTGPGTGKHIKIANQLILVPCSKLIMPSLGIRSHGVCGDEIEGLGLGDKTLITGFLIVFNRKALPGVGCWDKPI